jgi:hypothetical protein
MLAEPKRLARRIGKGGLFRFVGNAPANFPPHTASLSPEHCRYGPKALTPSIVFRPGPYARASADGCNFGVAFQLDAVGVRLRISAP